MSEEEDKEEVKIRYTIPEDGKYMKEWFMEPEILRWFPMADETEVDDAVNRWIWYYRYRSCITAVINDVPVGIATFYPQPYEKIKHQAELSIIVDPKFRNRKIGEKLMHYLIHLAKNNFKINLLHLTVYEGNPALSFYQRLGFIEFGRQSHWVMEADGKPRGRIFMERFI
jgi:GNAT superfamily N-acetyltransferase